jgi:hypothetical protein
MGTHELTLTHYYTDIPKSSQSFRTGLNIKHRFVSAQLLYFFGWSKERREHTWFAGHYWTHCTRAGWQMNVEH